MFKHNKGCVGCKDISFDKDSRCVIMKWGKKCPCRICLIKGICEEPCKEFEVFNDSIDTKKKLAEYNKSMLV